MLRILIAVWFLAFAAPTASASVNMSVEITTGAEVINQQNPCNPRIKRC